jgi:hypothetical protein
MVNETIRVYQIFYEGSQSKELDPAFIPLDARRSPEPRLYEIYWLLKLFDLGFYNDVDLAGVVSWKFRSKTHLTGTELIEFVRRNPGFDVYFVNPYPDLAYQFFNVWEHGERSHPGIKSLAQKLMDDAGYKLSIDEIGRNDYRSLLYCNFWVGSLRFWREYMRFLKPLFACSTDGHGARDKNPYFCMTTHDLRPAPFFPFIFERFFSTFLLANSSIKACPYVHSSRRTLLESWPPRADKDYVATTIRLIDDLDKRFCNDGASQEHRRLFNFFIDRGHAKPPAPRTDASRNDDFAWRGPHESLRGRAGLSR